MQPLSAKGTMSIDFGNGTVFDGYNDVYFLPTDMNRIYQGRVTRLEILGSDKTFLTAPCAGARDHQDQSTCALWGHHCVFQDAVNYYLLALAALSEGSEDRLAVDLRQRLEGCWRRSRARMPREQVPRGCATRFPRGLGLVRRQHSRRPSPPCSQETMPRRRPKPWPLNCCLIDVAGTVESKQGGNDYLPALCSSGWKGTPEFSPARRSASGRKDELAGILHGDPLMLTYAGSPRKWISPGRSRWNLTQFHERQAAASPASAQPSTTSPA